MDANSLCDITPETLNGWFNQQLQRVTPASAKSYLSWISVFLDWCVKEQLLGANPARWVDLPPVRKPFRKNFVPAKTVNKLIINCDDRELKYCLFCGFHAGMRFGEVVMSKPGWFDLPAKVVHVMRDAHFDTKDHEDRSIPLTDAFAEFLWDYGLPSPYMIAPSAWSDKAPYRFTFKRRFTHYVQSQGVEMTFHDCRRAFCSLHVSSGTSLYKVAKWIGDGIQVVEKHYGHLAAYDPEINEAFK